MKYYFELRTDVLLAISKCKEIKLIEIFALGHKCFQYPSKNCYARWSYFNFSFYRWKNNNAQSFFRGYHFLRNGGPKYTAGHKFWERKIGGHKICNDQNVGSHKMTTDSMFILFKKADFNAILACLGGKVYRLWGFCCRNRGSQFYWRRFFVNLEPPFRRKWQPP